jgi:hypothetical protein
MEEAVYKHHVLEVSSLKSMVNADHAFKARSLIQNLVESVFPQSAILTTSTKLKIQDVFLR